ncbi:hypothetical protein POSPLADRAFT_1040097 [Postia placenta MAD-698-R-SB12]|uniref:Uncharacterized protein n=1 Tax=Postia placenta MAD-698-R-SB12 TaxID=670580 RepID=A0A1X6MZ38_9APHY|nr:hypothetical protein POSPLADRAFT_1040097 [Postia placenta MAD-698-R-SB12]OSX61520.1 hypothetical protein POSPLADRAFT_1040097 [Postia placenta MAD-698-R-SB12]
MTGGGTASASMASASATSKFVHDSGALMRGAVASSPSPSVGVSQADAHALLRNEYIIMGGLGVVLVLLIAIFGVLAHGRRKAKAGYSVVGTGEGKF